MLALDVRYFLEVARLGSMGRAAESLGLSQPALSKAMARLERQAGTPLLARTTRGVTLTDAGQAFHARASTAAGHLEEGLQAARDIGDGHAGLLRLGMTPATSHFVLGALFPRLRTERPAAVLKLTTAFGDALFDALSRQELALAIGPMPPQLPRGIHAEPLFKEGFSVAFSKHHPLARRKAQALTPADLQGWDVAAPGPQEAARQITEQTLRSLGLPLPKVMVEANTLEPLLAAVVTSQLLTLVPSSTPRHALPDGLVTRPLPLSVMHRVIAIFKGDGDLSPVAERARQLLRDRASTLS